MPLLLCKSCHWLNDGHCTVGMNSWRYNAKEDESCEAYRSSRYTASSGRSVDAELEKALDKAFQAAFKGVDDE